MDSQNRAGRVARLTPTEGNVSLLLASAVGVGLLLRKLWTSSGSLEQPLRYKIRALPYYPGILPFKLDYEISYEYFQGVDLHRFSFKRFEADLINTRPLLWHRCVRTLLRDRRRLAHELETGPIL
jgi:hypothetical protein